MRYVSTKKKYVIKLGERNFGTNPRTWICIYWKNKTPQETIFMSFVRKYGSRSEAKKDLKRLQEWEGYEGAEVVKEV